MRYYSFCCAWGFGLLLVFGCGPSTSLHPITGKVLVDGKPAERAKVFFTPLDGSPVRRMAIVAEDGSFELAGKDGAPAGDYAVTVVWPIYTINGGEEIEIGDRLRKRYEDPQKPIAQVKIQEGPNELPPFELRSP